MPSRKPRPKVVAGGIAGAATIVVVWVLALAGVDMPPEVASALTVIFSFAAAYIKTDELSAAGGGSRE